MSELPVLDAIGLHKHYDLEGTDVPVLLGVDLSVSTGDRHALPGGDA